MVRALGGNRPVGPACESDYRSGSVATQYDAVLVGRAASRNGNRPDAASP